MGYERKEWMRMSAAELIHPDDRERFFARLTPVEGGPARRPPVAAGKPATA